jgi:isopentenyl diphosphate isomerase/L-lactate dehydrogenase-like FMN-dependent dehydrogenase
MLQRAKDARVDIMMLTVDSITGGNRERDLRTGFSIPFSLTLAGMPCARKRNDEKSLVLSRMPDFANHSAAAGLDDLGAGIGHVLAAEDANRSSIWQNEPNFNFSE